MADNWHKCTESCRRVFSGYGKLGSRSDSIDQPPDNTVIFTFFVQFNHADGIFRLNDHIAEILTASRNQKKVKINVLSGGWSMEADRLPSFRVI